MHMIVWENRIRDAGDDLRQQIRDRQKLHSRMRDCLKVLQSMEPMEKECKKLSLIMGRLDEENEHMLQMADVMTSAAEIYRRTEEWAAESALKSGMVLNGSDVIEVTVPHYEDGIISI